MRALRLQAALERLTAAIHDVESDLGAMKVAHDPWRRTSTRFGHRKVRDALTFFMANLNQ